MVKKRAHTPTPWKYNLIEDGTGKYSGDTSEFSHLGPFSGSEQICVDSIFGTKVDADFMIKAVNYHAELVEALRGLVSQCENNSEDDCLADLKEAKAALAKAEAP